MYEHNALGYWSGLTLCLTKVRSSRARCPATALISCTTRLSMKFKLLINDEIDHINRNFRFRSPTPVIYPADKC